MENSQKGPLINSTVKALIRSRLFYLRSPLAFALVAMLLSCMVLSLVSSPLALAGNDNEHGDYNHGDGQGHVYILNNNLGGENSITVFNRKDDGSLSLRGVTSIGGTGSLAAFADGTQGSLILTRDHDNERLFAADAGSNQISVIGVDDGRLHLLGVFPSGGDGPVSLTYQDGLLYVLNAANASQNAANVTGFRVRSNGKLEPISGSTRPLSAAHPNPAQVQIDPSGRFLVVTEKGTNLIDLYRVSKDGSLSGPTTFPSAGNYPFGMAFNPAHPRQFIVADGGKKNNDGAATTYRLTQGSLHLISGPVLDYQGAPCWMVVTRDGRYAYTSNAVSYSISGYRIRADGTLSLLNANGLTATTPKDTFPIEEGLSRNSRFLYVLESRLLLPTPGSATIGGFLIHGNGSLTSVVDPAKITLPFTAIGLASE
ncbi:MAG TPA: beta-propeller fold lactonase family protein [Chloroflexia bacterium]|nr:beta-propeller fold lactonase family protein [Chloroflexia bacterium]